MLQIGDRVLLLNEGSFSWNSTNMGDPRLSKDGKRIPITWDSVYGIVEAITRDSWRGTIAIKMFRKIDAVEVTLLGVDFNLMTFWERDLVRTSMSKNNLPLPSLEES